MDFGTLISVAQKNETKKQTVPCYQTKFTPQKKQSKQSKTLSDNIKKFLARKEEEEKRKALEEKRKMENLLSLRDQKTQNRINKHLKVCKSANKSVIEDAIDNENTAITIAGPSQPDEDDYGYESQTASALYNQFMSKYNSLPPEKPIFSSETRTVKDIASTKDRVKQALKQQELEESSGHRKKRKSSALNVKETESDEKAEKNNKEVNNKVKEDKDEKPKVKKKSLPPPMGFAELLKLAEKKQHEPVVIEVKPKVENERPMTKRQKIEYIQEKERKEQREKKNSEKKDSQKKDSEKKDSEKKDSEKKDSEKKDSEANKKTNVTSASSKLDKTHLNKVPKTNEKSVIINSMPNKSTSKVATTISKQIIDKPDDKHNIEKSNSSKSSSKNELLEERKKLEAERRQLEEMRRAIEEEKRKLIQSKNKLEDIKSQPSNKLNVTKPTKSINKQTPSKDIKPRQFPPSDLKLQSSVANTKPKQFPPSDVRPMKSKTVVKKASNKRRIYDDEEDESDLSDFIDDGPGDNEEDYSKHISEIFGYDKNKYKNIDEDEEEDVVMESNFAQQLKEEYISSKIGYMEDLEDMRMEALEKKRKAVLKRTKK